MRLLALVPVSLLAGCGKPADPVPVPPIAAPNPPAVVAEPAAIRVHRAEDGPVRVGTVDVSVEFSGWDRYDSSFDSVSVGVVIRIPKDAKSIIIKGWALDLDLIESRTGKNAERSRHLPVNFSAKSEKDTACRGVMRSISALRDPKGTEVEVREMKGEPGESYVWVMTFERPSQSAARYEIEFDAADLGGSGPVRFSVPNQMTWRLAKN